MDRAAAGTERNNAALHWKEFRLVFNSSLGGEIQGEKAEQTLGRETEEKRALIMLN